jgi:S1-C subfamily serine protease
VILRASMVRERFTWTKIEVGPQFRSPRIGVQPGALDDTARARVKLPPGRNGVLIEQVIDGQAAADAGLQNDDVILSIGETSLETDNPLGSLARAIRAVEPNKPVPFTIWRGGKEMTVSVTPRLR